MSRAREFADLASSAQAGGITGKNLVTNGAFQVAQRGTSVTGKNQNGYYACDRAQVYFSSIDQMFVTVSQDSDGPDGFTKSHKVLVTTAETAIETNDLHAILWYKIEGQDLQQLGYGDPNAKPLTLSFWVKSNVTGTYTVSFYGSIGGTDSVVAPTYTISAVNTWEYKTITISGSTVGALVNSNGTGLELYWNGLVGPDFTSGSAATSWASYTTDNWAVGHTADFGLDVNDYWQITGVQLEVGEQATPFEHRSFGDELARCQRYYHKSYNYADAPATATTLGIVSSTLLLSFQSTGYVETYNVPYAVKMRTAPTITVYDYSGNSGKCNYYQGGTLVANKTITSHVISEQRFAVYSDNSTSKGGIAFQFTADAEL